jgi:hypothetical protein
MWKDLDKAPNFLLAVRKCETKQEVPYFVTSTVKGFARLLSKCLNLVRL